MDLQKKLLSYREAGERLLAETVYRDSPGDETPLIPELAACRMIPTHLAREYRVIPVRVEGNKLIVAMPDPQNVIAIDDLRLITGMEIEPVQVKPEFVEKLLRKIYGVFDVEKVCENFETEYGASEREKLIAGDSKTESDAPIVQLVNSIVTRAIHESASDIHIEPKASVVKVRFRVDGLLREIMTLPPAVKHAVASRIKIMSDLDIAEKRLPQDGRIQYKIDERYVDLRVSIIPTVFGEKVVIRLLDPVNVEKFSLDNLGFSRQGLEQFKKVMMNSSGMILISGPTGSGKTTTLYALLKYLNGSEKNIVTVEDPVEYILDDVNQTQVNPRVGLTFAAGLRSILRQDPDVIMVGEIRDAETAAIAVRAATTGHLVLSTLHAGDAPEAITRLLDMGVAPYLVASSLLGVVAQRLVRLVCPLCRQKYEPVAGSPEFDFIRDEPIEDAFLFRATGCRYCGGTGYRGRMAIQEILVATPGVRNLILKKAGSKDIMRIALNEGMVTLKQDGLAKAALGLTTVHEVMRVAY